MTTVREALELDLDEVLRIERMAFGEEDEAELVQALLKDPSARPTLSLLALNKNNEAVGHVLFSKASVSTTTQGKEVLSVALLAPLAVIPEAQKQGVGTQLVREGFKRLSQSGVDLVFVLGDPKYYGRFGFQPAGSLGFEAPFPIPEKNADAWMVQALQSDLGGTVKGKVSCADALNKPEYWRE
jgi:putative acetyltransferase